MEESETTPVEPVETTTENVAEPVTTETQNIPAAPSLEAAVERADAALAVAEAQAASAEAALAAANAGPLIAVLLDAGTVSNAFGLWHRGQPRTDLTPEQIGELGPGFWTGPESEWKGMNDHASA